MPQASTSRFAALALTAVINGGILFSQSLEVWDFKFTDAETRIALERVDQQFRKDHPGIELTHRGYFDQEYIPALRTALLAGTGPDILWLHPGTEYSELQSYLEPLDTYLEDSDLTFRGDSLEISRTGEGILKALPLTVQGIGWYYNRELFRRAGLDPQSPPSNWDDFLHACEALKEKGITPIATGNNRPLTTGFIRRTLVAAFFKEDEIRDFYGNGRLVNDPRYRRVLDFCRDLRDRGYFHEEGLFRPYFKFAIETFSRGQAAMVPGLISDIAHWKTYSDALGPEQVGYFPNLIHPDMARPGVQLLQAGGILVCMNRSAEHKDTAFLYMEHLYSPKSQAILTRDLGLLSPLVPTYLPVETYPVLRDIRSAMESTSSDPDFTVPSLFLTDLQYRLEDLLINTREISVDEYLVKMTTEAGFY